MSATFRPRYSVSRAASAAQPAAAHLVDHRDLLGSRVLHRTSFVGLAGETGLEPAPGTTQGCSRAANTPGTTRSVRLVWRAAAHWVRRDTSGLRRALDSVVRGQRLPEQPGQATRPRRSSRIGSLHGPCPSRSVHVCTAGAHRCTDSGEGPSGRRAVLGQHEHAGRVDLDAGTHGRGQRDAAGSSGPWPTPAWPAPARRARPAGWRPGRRRSKLALPIGTCTLP